MLHERVVLLTVVTERVPYVAETCRMTVEALGKGVAEMILHFGFADAPRVPAALDAPRDEFPVDIDDTSFSMGRETPVLTMSPELSFWREKLGSSLSGVGSPHA